ncbi:MAG: Abi family protein [Bacteroidales bacterium]
MTKKKKKSTTIDEQIEILRKRGMVITNLDEAKAKLLDFGYFRLGFYSFPFEKKYPDKKNRDHIFKQNTNFRDVIDLYDFDSNLRDIFSRYLSRIEINFRTKMIYIVSNSNKDCPTWFANEKIVCLNYANSFSYKVYDNSFKQNQTIKEHHSKYSKEMYAPAWKTLEFMTFGNILTLYSNLRSVELQQEIANEYGCRSEKVFFNYMDTLRRIRNYCAHFNLLYDLNLPKSIINGPAGKLNGKQHNLDGIIMVAEYILGFISPDIKKDFIDEINTLYEVAPKSISEIITMCRKK